MFRRVKITRKAFSLPILVAALCAGWKKTNLVGLVFETCREL